MKVILIVLLTATTCFSQYLNDLDKFEITDKDSVNIYAEALNAVGSLTAYKLPLDSVKVWIRETIETLVVSDSAFIDTLTANENNFTRITVSDSANTDTLKANTVYAGTINYLGASDNVAGTDSFMVSPSHAVTLTTGAFYLFYADTANTGGCVLGIAGVDTVALKSLNDQDPADNYIEANHMIWSIYNGTELEIQTPDANP